MTYPPPPPPPDVPKKRPRMRGRTGIRVGAILSIVGLALLIVGFVVLGTQTLSKVDGFQRVKIADGSGTLNFSHTGQYVAYYEAPDVSSSISRLPSVELAISNQSTKAIVAIKPYGDRADGKIKKLTYDYNGHHGAALAQFDIPQAGTYDVAVQVGAVVDPAADLAFGASIEKATIVGGLLTVAGSLLLVAGLVVLIIGLVRRRRHKRELAAGGGPPQAYQPYPNEGYPQPPYPPQGYPQPYPQAGYQQPNYPPPSYPQQGYPPAYPPPGYGPYAPSDHPTNEDPPDQAQRENPWPPRE